MVEESSVQITVKFTPWEDKGFSISFLHIGEFVGGKIPEGEMELFHKGIQEQLDFITTQQTGLLEIKDDKEGGLSYSFGIFITNRRTLNNILTLSFVIVPADRNGKYDWGQEFYTRPDSGTFDNIRDAVKFTWKGAIDKDNVDTDINDGIKIRRCNESGLKFLTRVCYSWKYRSIFAFSWDGLIIRDIGDNTKTDLEFQTGAGLWYQTKVFNLKYNKYSNYNLFDSWINPYKDVEGSVSISSTREKDFSNEQPKYVTSLNYYNTSYICAPGYEILHRNREENMEFKGYSQITVVGQDMPKKWKLGDLVMYKRLDTAQSEEGMSPTKCVVVGNEFFFSNDGASQVGPNGYRLEWTINLWSLEKLPVSEELNNNKGNE